MITINFSYNKIQVYFYEPLSRSEFQQMQRQNRKQAKNSPTIKK